MPDRSIVHIEFSAKDHEAAGKFYSDLFGWKTTPFPELNYTMFEYADQQGGGFNPLSDENPAGTVVPYIASEDIEADLAKAESLGGRILRHQTEIPGMGWYGVFIDPTGNRVGLFTVQQPGS
jgi:predicted enzyme related to lactoylglutathione lyase